MTKTIKYYLFFSLLLYVNAVLHTLLPSLNVPENPNIIVVIVNMLAGLLIFVKLFKPTKIDWIRVVIAVILGAGLYILMAYWCYIFAGHVHSTLSEPVALLFSVIMEMFFAALNVAIFYLMACFSVNEKFAPVKLKKLFLMKFILLLAVTAVIAFAIRACAITVGGAGFFGNFGSGVGRYYLSTFELLRSGLPVVAIMITAMWVDLRRERV